MNLQVIWAPAALREVLAIFDYLTEFNAQAASQVFDALIEVGDGLANFPRRGRSVAGTDLREVMARYPYIIRYRVAGDVVRILRVRHVARRSVP